MSVRLLLRWELRDSLRSYWFLANAGVFLAGGLILMLVGGTGASVLGYRGFARALAGFVQLALFLVPLMALIPSTAAIAGEREMGSLDYLLAQPITRGEAYAGKWAGLSAALLLSLLVAFAVTGAVAALRGVPPVLLAGLLGLTLLLAAAFVSIGLWISAGAPSRARATAVGLAAWLFLLALGSLGLMGALVRWGVPAWLLQAWSLANPVEAYRIATIVLLDPGVELLGPAGAALLETLGRPALVAVACLSLTGWTGGAAWAGRRAFAAS